MELAVGDPAPDFTLHDQNGDQVRLKDFHGKTVVLYFYPKDDTPGCTQEACDFRDYEKDYFRLNAVIVGISKDTEASHAKFMAKYGLPFALLSDPERTAIQAYGVWQNKTYMGKTAPGVVRTTFVIDPRGKISRIYRKVKVAGHVAAVLDDLKKERRA